MAQLAVFLFYVQLAEGSTLSWVELILHKNTKISLPPAANFFYNLTHDLAVIHGAELAYLFMVWDQHNINETDIQLANFFGESWTNFAKNGYFFIQEK